MNSNSSVSQKMNKIQFNRINSNVEVLKRDYSTAQVKVQDRDRDIQNTTSAH